MSSEELFLFYSCVLIALASFLSKQRKKTVRLLLPSDCWSEKGSPPSSSLYRVYRVYFLFYLCWFGWRACPLPPSLWCYKH